MTAARLPSEATPGNRDIVFDLISHKSKAGKRLQILDRVSVLATPSLSRTDGPRPVCPKKLFFGKLGVPNFVPHLNRNS